MEGSIAKIFVGFLLSAANAFVNKPTFAPISTTTGASVPVFLSIALTNLDKITLFPLLIMNFFRLVDFAQSASHLIFWLKENILLNSIDSTCKIVKTPKEVKKTVGYRLVYYDFKC